MAEPNRHYSIGGLLGLIIFIIFRSWWALVLGFIVSFISHLYIDWTFSECWRKTHAQDILEGVICGLFLIFSFIITGTIYGWWAVSLMFVGCLGMDIIDEVRAFLKLKPLFCCHYGSDCYKPGWFKEETFWQTVIWGSISSVLMVAISYLVMYLEIKMM